MAPPLQEDNSGLLDGTAAHRARLARTERQIVRALLLALPETERCPLTGSTVSGGLNNRLIRIRRATGAGVNPSSDVPEEIVSHSEAVVDHNGFAIDPILLGQLLRPNLARFLEHLADPNRGVLVRFRLPGSSGGLMMNPKLHLEIDRLLRDMNHGKIVFAELPNGSQVEEWLQGDSWSPADMGAPRVLRGIARELGRLHAIPLSTSIQTLFQAESDAWRTAVAAGRVIDGLKSIPTLLLCERSVVWLRLCVGLNAVRSAIFQDEGTCQDEYRLLHDTLESLNALAEQFQEREKHGTGTSISPSAYDMVLSHNDLLSGNIINCSNPTSARCQVNCASVPAASDLEGVAIKFIDYEFAGPGQRGFDLANHFFEHCGFECRLENYPPVEMQRSFLRTYVECWRQQQSAKTAGSPMNDRSDTLDGRPLLDCEDNQSAEALLMEIPYFVNLSHLFWGTWSWLLAKSASSATFNNFDYLQYAKMRLNLTIAALKLSLPRNAPPK